MSDERFKRLVFCYLFLILASTTAMAPIAFFWIGVAAIELVQAFWPRKQ